MFAFDHGCAAVTLRRALLCAVAAASALLAGCAQANRQYVEEPQVAGYVAEVAQIEGDGLPTQAAPSAGGRETPDDPNEPYSRNYGGQNPASLLDKPVRKAEAEAEDEGGHEKPYLPNDLPSDFRRRLSAAIDTAG